MLNICIIISNDSFNQHWSRHIVTKIMSAALSLIRCTGIVIFSNKPLEGSDFKCAEKNKPGTV